MRPVRLLGISLAAVLLLGACSEPAGTSGEDRGNVVIGRAGSDANPELVTEYLLAIESHPGRRTRRQQLALRNTALGAELLRQSIPKLISCALPEVHALLEEFAAALPDPPDLSIDDEEFVNDYGYGIGLLSYYNLAVQAADTEFGETSNDEVYESCDLSQLSNATLDAELAALGAVLESEEVLRVLAALQPELVEWRACLSEAGIATESFAFVGVEDLDLLARRTFDELADEYFEVFSSLLDQRLSYEELLQGHLDGSAVPEVLAAIAHLKTIQEREISLARLDQACYEEHVGDAFTLVQAAELQRLQRDWPNL